MLNRSPDRLSGSFYVPPEAQEMFGSLPKDFLNRQQLNHTRLSPDYKNRLPQPMIWQVIHCNLLPTVTGNKCQALAQRQLLHTISYTQYWQEQIAQYNRSLARGSFLDERSVLRLLVEDVPGGDRLDKLASELRLLGVWSVLGMRSFKDLTNPVITQVAEAYEIIDGEGREKIQVLKMFGLFRN